MNIPKIKKIITSSNFYITYFGDAEATIRYEFCSKILKPYIKGVEKISIVDLGGGARTIYPELYKNVKSGNVTLTSIDTNFNKKIMSGYVTYRTPTNPIHDLFDIAISLDTLEHISPQDRDSFVSHLDSISKKLIILTFPSGNLAFLQDKNLYNTYTEKYGTPHKYLEEHIMYGLPDISNVVKYFEKRGYIVKRFPNINIKYRKLFMLLWIKFPIIFRMLTPFIIFIGKLTNYGTCYREFILVNKKQPN